MATVVWMLRVTRASMPDAMVRLKAGVSRVGRGSTCTVVVADQSLSREHFELNWDSRVCTIRDLDSRNGVLLNGQAIHDGVVAPGDTITAGAVTFRLETTMSRLSGPDDGNTLGASASVLEPHPIFARVEPTLSPIGPPSRPGTLVHALTFALHSAENAAAVYAIVDGAQAFNLAYEARMMGHDLYTLFTGSLADAAARVGPCLVRPRDPSAFLRRWVAELGSHAGVLFEGPDDLDVLCRHLRTIFVATDEERQEYFFRFYDPRVLRTFLPTCRPGELAEFFGPIHRWIVEDEAASGFLTYRLRNGALEQDAIAPAIG